MNAALRAQRAGERLAREKSIQTPDWEWIGKRHGMKLEKLSRLRSYGEYLHKRGGN